MCLRSLGFVLILFPGVLQAQGCDAPRLLHGIFIPKQETHSHGTTITYACDNGYKPAVAGWWATSTCQHGTWSHEPQCIGESACLPPSIPNAKYRENSTGWYEDGSTLRITCEAGFEHKNQNTTTTCGNGNWSPVPVCKKSISACSAPPKIPHAVIINQGYQEVFAAGSQVQYHCEDGYTNMGEDTIICEAGLWTTGPTCRSADTSGSNNRDSGPALRNILLCGNRPVIQNAEVVEEHPMYLKYQCNSYYRRVGPETVSCYSDGSWSQLPTCEEAFCVMDAAEYARDGVKPGQREYIQDGETKVFQCPSWGSYINVRCTNRRITLTRCCSSYERRYYEECRRFREPY